MDWQSNVPGPAVTIATPGTPLYTLASMPPNTAHRPRLRNSCCRIGSKHSGSFVSNLLIHSMIFQGENDK